MLPLVGRMLALQRTLSKRATPPDETVRQHQIIALSAPVARVRVHPKPLEFEVAVALNRLQICSLPCGAATGGRRRAGSTVPLRVR